MALFFAASICSSHAQTIMFDDFTYSGVNDSELSSFNNWNIVNGISGPPSNGQYESDNITFIQDPDNTANTLMTLSTTVKGASQATTHSRIETDGFDYFEGTYAAKVYFSDVPNTYQDANIQTFYTIVSESLGTDGSKYSEIDFEYMASDQWGISTDNPVLYLTSWNRYIADPWQAWKRYFSYQQSYEGWHTFVVSCTDGTNVKFWIDGEYMGAMATTDNDGTSVYPRSPMQIAFANWIWNNQLGGSSADRNTTMEVDWVLYYDEEELSPEGVEALVQEYRAQGLQRRNLDGQTYITSTNQAPEVSITSPSTGTEYDAPASVTVQASASDDGSVAAVDFYVNDVFYYSDASSPYSYTLSDLAAGTYSIKAIATDDQGATASDEIAITVLSDETDFRLFIEAEDYDQMQGVEVEATTDDGGGYNVGYIDATDWLVYAGITIPESGYYTIKFRLACPDGDGQISLDVNAGALVLDEFDVPATGGWQSWTTVTRTVYIEAGTYDFGLYAGVGNWNINWWSIAGASSASGRLQKAGVQASEMTQSLLQVYPNPTEGTLNIVTGTSSTRISIFNTCGQQVLNQVVSGYATVDISGLQQGIYMLKAEIDGKHEIQRIIKK